MMSAAALSFDPDFAGAGDWACMYRASGVQVVPCYSAKEVGPGVSWKRPKLADWTHLQEELVPDATFDRWYGRNGDHARRDNMGLLTGRASDNIFVIDLDDHKGPEAAAWWQGVLLEHNQGIEPETWQQTTGGGGRQLFFRARPDWHAPTNRTPIGVDIRGQGGFAVMPPSMHETGRRYTWREGAAPYDIEVETAPEWLLFAVEELVERHGGDKGGGNRQTTARPASPGDFTAFGKRQDGREDYMTRLVWGAVLDMHRECPIGPPPQAEQIAAMDAAFETYLRTVTSNLAGDKEAGLEREGRGRSLFVAKWKRAVAQWDGKVAEEAAKPRPKDQYQEEEPPQPDPVDPDTGKPLPLILTATQFVAGFTPPDYLIDGIAQRGYLYSLTARTGHGKTAVGMYLAQAIARGQTVKGREVKAGTVLYLAGENPDDIRARFLVLAEAQGFDPAEIAMRFVAGVIDIESSLPRIRAEAAEISDLMLVIVDTAAAYFRGDDGNSNVQQGNYARLLRELTFLPGKPAVMVAAHPVKNASKENLLPVGGGAFLNEVDGNLTLWANAEKQTTLHWQGKFRGPEFDPITFRLDTRMSDRVHDSNGELIPSVVAVPISDQEMEAGERTQEADEDVMLLTLDRFKNVSVARLARECRWMSETGEPQKSKAFRVLRRLVDDKLAEIVRGKYRLTAKGKKEIGANDE